MKGISIDAKTGKVKKIDDGLPMPACTPMVMPEGLDLALAAQKLKEFDALKARVEKLEEK